MRKLSATGSTSRSRTCLDLCWSLQSFGYPKSAVDVLTNTLVVIYYFVEASRQVQPVLPEADFNRPRQHFAASVRFISSLPGNALG